MRKTLCALTVLSLALIVSGPLVARDDEGGKAEEKRAQIDAMAQETLNELFELNKNAKKLYKESAGWAVFNNLKVAVGISGGAGTGVAVDDDGGRTYMKMGTGGIGLGLGGQRYRVVFLFEDEKKFRNFVDKGWKADASAHAAAGTEGAAARTGFVEGIAVYQMTEAGLMAAADITGTKYWKNKKLNTTE